MVEATSLLAQIAAGDRTALSQLYDRYSRIIYAIAWKSLNSAEDCEEVVLDVFAQVWRIADRFDVSKGSAEQWLFTLARSRILDRLRKLQRLHKVNQAIEAGKEIEFPTMSVDRTGLLSRANAYRNRYPDWTLSRYGQNSAQTGIE
jgi:RNA polymerase sigma-70 factor, ECF subfamily